MCTILKVKIFHILKNIFLLGTGIPNATIRITRITDLGFRGPTKSHVWDRCYLFSLIRPSPELRRVVQQMICCIGLGRYGWGQMSHSLAWAYEVSGLAPSKVFAFDGKSDAGVDYFDAATVRCSNGGRSRKMLICCCPLSL